MKRTFYFKSTSGSHIKQEILPSLNKDYVNIIETAICNRANIFGLILKTRSITEKILLEEEGYYFTEPSYCLITRRAFKNYLNKYMREVIGVVKNL